MSVVTRNQDGTLNYGGSINGRPGQIQQDPLLAQQQAQRQAVMNQLGQPQPTQAAGPVANNPGTFARGGQVKQVPTGDLAGTLTRTAAGTGTQIAGKLLGNTAGGAAVGSGIAIGGNMLADKVRKKEDMPTFGGENAEYLDQYGRRFQGTGGGTAAGAIRGASYGANPALVAATGGLSVVGGALIGAGIAAAKRHAASANTDFRVEDAAEAIHNAYRGELGRDATDAEVMQHLVNGGFDPKDGDRWVGEKGLNYIIGTSIKGSDEAKQFRDTGMSAPQRQALMAQLGGGPTASDDLSGRASSPATAGGAGAAMGGGGGGGLAAASNQGTWNTDGYAAPQVTAQNAGPVPAGWDAEKWQNADHQTPKYAVGRILSQFPPTVDGLAQAAEQVAAAYPGASFNGKDKLTIPGVGTIDVLKGAGNGGEAWQWLPDEGAGAAVPAAAGGVAMDAGGPLTVADLSDPQRMAAILAELDRIGKNEPPRTELLQQLGA